MPLQFAVASGSGPIPQPLSLVEEISHRVINEYTEAIAMLRLAAARELNPQTQATLVGAANRLRAQAEAHRALQAPPVQGSVELSDYLERICLCLSQSPLLTKDVWLSVINDGEVWLDRDRCWRVGLIVAELVRNAARHGLAGGPGLIRVAIERCAGQVVCAVRDNGRQDPGASSGRGRHLVQTLARELGGSIDWSLGGLGCVARLEFPETVSVDDAIESWASPPQPPLA